MRLSAIGESSLLKTIRERFGGAAPGVIVGIGDDASVVRSPGSKLLLTSDMMVEGVHFDRAFVTPYQVGFKIVSVNVSDIYAMGGTPRFLLLDIAADPETEEGFIESFFEGLQRALGLYGLSLVGGDLSSSKKGLFVSASLVGFAEAPLLRSSAKPGDKIYVTGTLGDSACGLEVLRRIRKTVPIDMVAPGFISSFIAELSRLGVSWNNAEPLLRRHLMPEARNPRKLLKKAKAMVDISDGLFIDLSRLCEESGVGARIYAGKIPLSSRMKETAGALGLEPFRLATTGGEDYELLFTAPREARIGLHCIGEITASGRVIVDLKGGERPFQAEGYTHWH